MRRGLATFLASFAFVVTGQLAIAAEPSDAVRAFVEQVNQASMNFFSSGSEADALDRCRQLLSWAFDIPASAEYVLGMATAPNPSWPLNARVRLVGVDLKSIVNSPSLFGRLIDLMVATCPGKPSILLQGGSVLGRPLIQQRE